MNVPTSESDIYNSYELSVIGIYLPRPTTQGFPYQVCSLIQAFIKSINVVYPDKIIIIIINKPAHSLPACDPKLPHAKIDAGQSSNGLHLPVCK